MTKYAQISERESGLIYIYLSEKKDETMIKLRFSQVFELKVKTLNLRPNSDLPGAHLTFTSLGLRPELDNTNLDFAHPSFLLS